MKKQVKTFSQFVNESDDHRSNKGGIAQVTLEFSWTWADQMDEEAALKELQSSLNDLPDSIQTDRNIELSGWDRDEDEVDYSNPYLANLTLTFSGDRDNFTKELANWLSDTNVLELYGIDFN